MENIRKVRAVYTLCVFIALAAFDNIVIGLFPPLYKEQKFISKSHTSHTDTKLKDFRIREAIYL